MVLQKIKDILYSAEKKTHKIFGLNLKQPKEKTTRNKKTNKIFDQLHVK